MWLNVAKCGLFRDYTVLTCQKMLFTHKTRKASQEHQKQIVTRISLDLFLQKT